MTSEHAQADYRVRFEWGLAGAHALTAQARPGDVAVVVDVLSFTTSVALAVEAGIAVYPYPWAEAGAPAYADKQRAVLAVGRRAALTRAPGQQLVSLSPASFEGVSGITRVVLPSPNGAAISFALADAGVTTVAACLRNATAVGRWLRDVEGAVCVVAAGEQWPDGQLRPALEDLWGAGAVVSALGLGASSPSPEAGAAATSYDAVAPRLGAILPTTASGRELVAAGFVRDVELAAETGVSQVVPVLRDGAFVGA